MSILTTAPTDSLALFNIASLTDETILVNTMMQHSFYLPVDILRHHAWKVHPILVLSAEKFSEFLEYISDISNLHTHYEISMVAACLAKQVGISARKHLDTGEVYLVIKPWYGKNPYQKGSDTAKESTLDEIFEVAKFIATVTNSTL